MSLTGWHLVPCQCQDDTRSHVSGRMTRGPVSLAEWHEVPCHWLDDTRSHVIGRMARRPMSMSGWHEVPCQWLGDTRSHGIVRMTRGPMALSGWQEVPFHGHDHHVVAIIGEKYRNHYTRPPVYACFDPGFDTLDLERVFNYSFQVRRNDKYDIHKIKCSLHIISLSKRVLLHIWWKWNRVLLFRLQKCVFLVQNPRVFQEGGIIASLVNDRVLMWRHCSIMSNVTHSIIAAQWL